MAAFVMVVPGVAGRGLCALAVILAVTLAGLAATVSWAGAPVPFTEEAQARGIDYLVQPLAPYDGWGRGVAFVDLDNDDRADLALIDELRDVVLLELNWCYADCDQSTGPGELDLFDFLCFQGSFVGSESYACDCDTSTGPLVCDLFDFLCFQDAFVGGCP